MISRKKIFYCGGGLSFLILMLLFLAPAQGFAAATFTVNSTTDAVVANAVVGGVCETAVGNGICTLRAAIQLANVPGQGQTTIILPAGTYTLTLLGPGENLAATGDLDITSLSPVTINGAGAATTIIDGDNADRVFQTAGAVILTISGVTIQHGNPGLAAAGGGIDIGGGGSVTLNNVVVTANTAAADGGGINNGGTLSLNNVAITGNTFAGGGAGISMGLVSTLTFTNGTISSNTGRGIDNKGTINLTNVTISGNNAASGAGINMGVAGATAHLLNATITGNIAGVNVGGIDNAVGGTVTIQNSIVSNNTATNCGGVISSLGNNIDDGNSCALVVGAGDLINTDPKLNATLADNGGAVQTHALLIGSPAIDSGATGTVCPPTDARGITRPFAGLPPAAAACDIGAFEFRPQKIVISPLLIFDFGSVTVGATADHAFTLTNAGDGDLNIGAVAAVDTLAPPFSIPANTCTAGFTLKLIPVTAPTSCIITTRFAPTAVGPAADTFDVPSNDPMTPAATISLSGTGAAGPVPNISVTDSIAPDNDQKLPFGDVTVDLTSDATVTVTNTGTAALTIGTIAPPAAPFSITSDGCSSQTLSANATCSLTVRFAPKTNTQASDSFAIPVGNVPGTTSVTLTLTGSGVSATGNHAPSVPVLVSPVDGQAGVPTTFTFLWNRSVDPDGDAVTYHFYNCTDSTFTGADCAPVTVASAAGLWFAGLGSFGAGVILIGFVAKNGSGRSRMMMLAIMLILVSGAFFVSCHSSSSETPPPPAEQISNVVRNLVPNTTYHWKVVADDGKGGTASSPVSSYTTAAQ